MRGFCGHIFGRDNGRLSRRIDSLINCRRLSRSEPRQRARRRFTRRVRDSLTPLRCAPLFYGLSARCEIHAPRKWRRERKYRRHASRARRPQARDTSSITFLSVAPIARRAPTPLSRARRDRSSSFYTDEKQIRKAAARRRAIVAYKYLIVPRPRLREGIEFRVYELMRERRL